MDDERKATRGTQSAKADSLAAEAIAQDERRTQIQHPRMRALIRAFGGKVQVGAKR